MPVKTYPAGAPDPYDRTDDQIKTNGKKSDVTATPVKGKSGLSGPMRDVLKRGK